MIPMAVSRLLLNGMRKLCKKVPNTISEAPQMLPNTAAFSQISLFFPISSDRFRVNALSLGYLRQFAAANVINMTVSTKY